MSDCCTFLGMIGHGLPGIVTQATRATPVVLNGLVLGARLHLDSDQSMSLTQYCGETSLYLAYPRSVV